MENNKEYRKLDSLKTWKDNPRDITEEGLERLKGHVSRHGQIKPLIITKDGTVLGGNMRLRAYRELGIEDVWVSVVEAESDNAKLAFALSDNEHAGYYEETALADLAKTTDIDLTKFHTQLSESLSIGFLLNQESEVTEKKERELDTNDNAQKLADFLANPNKQIVLFFMPEEYKDFEQRLEEFKQREGIEDMAEVVKRLLDIHEEKK